jgi:predicted RecB family nuclease
MASTGQVRLGGYPAKKCPRVTHNLNAPGVPAPLEVSEDLRTRFDEGIEFEGYVTDLLVDRLGDKARLLDDALGWRTSEEATLAAMRDRVPVIINGRLPAVEARVGAPDVLVLVDGGYLPVDIKHHGTFGSQKTRTLTYADLANPGVRLTQNGRSGDGGHRGDDCLQLAHYTRMLQALGFHPCTGDAAGPLWGGIIGTSPFVDLTGDEVGVTWYDLSAPYETTYSNSTVNHRKKRSPLERYDHEFAFRIDVARAAREGRELVTPVGTAECFECEWQDYCTSIVSSDDPSFAFRKGRLSTREWLFLREHGAGTVEDLAALDVDEVIDEFALHSVNTRGVRTRLEAAVERARMIRDDVDLEPLGAWPEVPSADVEIDFDIEWDPVGRIYQWGMRVRHDQDESTAGYTPAVSFDPLDKDGEAALAAEFAEALRDVIAEARTARQSVAIYHWSHVELSRTGRFPDVAAALSGNTVDLMAWMQAHFRVRDSFSIKDVAPLFGFSWGLDDAGGYTSLRQIEMARLEGPEAEAARQWCLDYNEADVAAQAAIRDGLRLRASTDSAAGVDQR